MAGSTIRTSSVARRRALQVQLVGKGIGRWGQHCEEHATTIDWLQAGDLKLPRNLKIAETY
jgi:hypothetical protein